MAGIHQNKTCQGKNRTKRNFTLMELLVVVAIIAILASILLPTLNKAINKAHQITCTGNQKQVGMAIFSYLGDNNDYLPLYINSAARDMYGLLYDYAPSPYAAKYANTTANERNYGPYAYAWKVGSIPVCPTAATSNYPYFTGDRTDKFRLTYIPIRCNNDSGCSTHRDNAWTHLKDANGVSYSSNYPEGRRMTQIRGRILLGEQNYVESATPTGKDFKVMRNQSCIPCWVRGTTESSKLCIGGKIHDNFQSGNWLYTDGHVGYHIYTPLMMQNGTQYFMGR